MAPEYIGGIGVAAEEAAALEPAGRASEPAGRDTEPAGRVLDPVWRFPEQARRASEEAAVPRGPWIKLREP